MIALDTNVLLRYFAQDDEQQSPVADALMASLTADEPGWIGITTLLELVWAMGKKIQAGKPLVCRVLEQLLSLDNLVIEQAAVIATAVRQFRSTRADFADCLLAAAAKNAGCTKVVTFDRIAARDLGMELLHTSSRS